MVKCIVEICFVFSAAFVLSFKIPRCRFRSFHSLYYIIILKSTYTLSHPRMACIRFCLALALAFWLFIWWWQHASGLAWHRHIASVNWMTCSWISNRWSKRESERDWMPPRSAYWHINTHNSAWETISRTFVWFNRILWHFAQLLDCG